MNCGSIHLQVQGFVCPITDTVITADSANAFCEKCERIIIPVDRKCTKADVARAKKLRMKAIPKWIKENKEEIEVLE